MKPSMRRLLLCGLCLGIACGARHAAWADGPAERAVKKLDALKVKPTPKLSVEAKVLNISKETSFSKLVKPDLYIAAAADLTALGDTRPLQDRMWVRIGNQGLREAKNVDVFAYFWRIEGGAGKRYAARVMTIPLLKPGQTVTLYPYQPGVVSGAPISWAIRIDPFDAIKEGREDNNRTGRLWTTYPDYFLRRIEFEAAP
jgi:hypothetical protein